MTPKIINAGSSPLFEISIDEKGLNIVIKTVGGGQPDFLVMKPVVGQLIRHLQELEPHLKH